jgi:hypothetical protein
VGAAQLAGRQRRRNRFASKAVALLHDPAAVHEGVTALEAHNPMALILWEKFLTLFP